MRPTASCNGSKRHMQTQYGPIGNLIKPISLRVEAYVHGLCPVMHVHRSSPIATVQPDTPFRPSAEWAATERDEEIHQPVFRSSGGRHKHDSLGQDSLQDYLLEQYIIDRRRLIQGLFIDGNWRG
jgi:hypothetical protein